MNMKRFILIIALLWTVSAAGQVLQQEDAPVIGAQVFIEPGQTAEQVDGWFRTLAENSMKVCRIRMFESYMRTPDGWDFTLFDRAFEAADRHGVKIYATLFPATAKDDIGGWKFPYDEHQKASFGEFIDVLVSHYKNHPALKGWVLINEPGVGAAPRNPYVDACRREWIAGNPTPEFTPDGYPVLVSLHEDEFLKDLNSDFLGWIAERIRKTDAMHDIHVNTHAIFNNCSQYDFPQWRTFLTSLGGSAHAAWHFGYFDRREYALAMLANSEIIRSGSGDLPWLMTELQGGNNTYSGMHALCPTPEEIAQWLWIVMATEGKGAIFWMLNPRSSGIEAGEWAMLDFKNMPSARLDAASEVAASVKANESLMSDLKVVPSGVDVIYFRESLWAEQKLAVKNDRYAGRQEGAVMKSALACFRALTEEGLNVGFKEASEYDFTQDDYTGHSIVIANQIAVPEKYAESLDHFVSHGGTLFVEGLSFYFNEYLQTYMNSRFPFEKTFGTSVSEFILKDSIFVVEVDGNSLPCHLWEGLFPDEKSHMLVNEYGHGKVVWLPSNVAMGAWETKDFAPLADLLSSEMDYDRDAICFDRYCPGLMMRTLKTGKGYMVVCINKSGKSVETGLRGVDADARIKEIYASSGVRFADGRLTMPDEATAVYYVK
ncbi:MAG: hypothetical protein E7124_02330 [Bacteroidales bacterium]|nr:hypothetical protein [Bacteroidales bacterium]